MGVLQQAAGALVGGLAAVHEDLLYVANFFAYMRLPRVRVAEGFGRCRDVGAIGVELDGVCYRYPASAKSVLEEVSVRFRAGDLVAVVGANGSGKTTLLRLIARLCPPDSGELRVDGVPARALSASLFWQRVAFAFQEPARFQATLRENVIAGLGRNLPDGMVEVALEKVGADAVTLGLASGLDTLLGRDFDGGVELSSGQWQRVALARASVRGAGLVLMDEPTSAQDGAGERDVLRLLREMPGATRIVVTHSPVIAAGCDHVVVLEAGRVVQMGSWTTLLAQDGALSRLFTGTVTTGEERVGGAS